METAENVIQVLPRLNEPAPYFEAVTTHGPRKLIDFRGRWLVLFSHPADFTPVCTTEFLAFAKAYPEFLKIQTELLGLSIDSISAHIAWIRNIHDKFGVDIPFPVIADLDMKVAKAYGMIHPAASDSSAVRTVFVIDPAQKVRALLYYPMTNGRSVNEILRLVQALQTSDKENVATPEGWKVGEPILLKPPTTQSEAVERVRNGNGEVVDWYFTTRELVTR